MAASELMLMLLLWLPSQPAGQPANAATVFRYVPAQADVTVTVDAGSLSRSMMTGFKDLGSQPFLKRSRHLSNTYGKINTAIARGLMMMKTMGGVDPLKDIRWATFSAKVGPRGMPKWCAAIGGTLPANVAERLAMMSRAGGAQALANGKLWVSTKRGQPSFGWTKDSVLLAGEESMLKSLLRRRPRASALSRLAASQHDGQTFFTMAMRPPKNARMQRNMLRVLPPFVRPLGASFSGVVASLRYDGLTLAVAGRDRRVLARYRKMLDGSGDYLAAAELIARGSLKIADGVLSPRDARRMPAALRGLATNKKELLRYLRRYVPLSRTPTHTTAIDGRRKLAKLSYKGSRYAGMVPLLGIVGFFTATRSVRVRMSPPVSPPAVPRARP